jgi:hypothetical protein
LCQEKEIEEDDDKENGNEEEQADKNHCKYEFIITGDEEAA